MAKKEESTNMVERFAEFKELKHIDKTEFAFMTLELRVDGLFLQVEYLGLEGLAQAEFKELKHIDKTTMISVLEESFRNVLAKMFGTDENLDVIMNPVFSEHLDFIADVFLVLAFYLERRGQPRRPYFEAIILFVAVKDFLDPAGDGGAGVYVDALGTVELDHNSPENTYPDKANKLNILKFS